MNDGSHVCASHLSCKLFAIAPEGVEALQLLGGDEGAEVGEHVQRSPRVPRRQQQLQRRLRRRDAVQLLQLRRHVPQVLPPRSQSLAHR